MSCEDIGENGDDEMSDGELNCLNQEGDGGGDGEESDGAGDDANEAIGWGRVDDGKDGGNSDEDDNGDGDASGSDNEMWQSRQCQRD